MLSRSDRASASVSTASRLRTREPRAVGRGWRGPKRACVGSTWLCNPRRFEGTVHKAHTGSE
ncbi:hypothetical protein B0H67DRAFT_561603 [Lasiosphaeris hirsuta]|uniref:Uncharacterized protein n=1 Tax=Lasiosphaeris hirsuta TaxID=260670 RepID=A0AA40E9V5_9PEZI|nr:hypothetical protein B0H67DRAFT_561603 [Lasiosphaeris hirsuta]